MTKTQDNVFTTALAKAMKAAPKEAPVKRGPNCKDDIAETLAEFVALKIGELDFISQKQGEKILAKAWRIFYTGPMPNGTGDGLTVVPRKKKDGKKKTGLAGAVGGEEAEEEEEVEVPEEAEMKKMHINKLKKLYASIHGQKPRGQPKKETLITRILEACD